MCLSGVVFKRLGSAQRLGEWMFGVNGMNPRAGRVVTMHSSLQIPYDTSRNTPEVPGQRCVPSNHGWNGRGQGVAMLSGTRPGFEVLFTFAITMSPYLPSARLDVCFHLMVVSLRRLWHCYERRAARLAERLMCRHLSSVPLSSGCIHHTTPVQWYAPLLYTTMVVRVQDSPFLTGNGGLATMRCGRWWMLDASTPQRMSALGPFSDGSSLHDRTPVSFVPRFTDVRWGPQPSAEPQLALQCGHTSAHGVR